MEVAADADGEAIGLEQFANGSPMIAVAAIVASSCNTAEHHLAARPDAEAELDIDVFAMKDDLAADGDRSEEHTSELQSLMRISYAVFCLKKKINIKVKRTKLLSTIK